MINVTKLKQQLKQNTLRNLYLFYGEERYLIETYVKKISEIAIGGGLFEFNYSLYDEDNESCESFLNDLESYPTMSEKKVIVLKEVGFLKLKDYQKTLADILNNVPEYAVVIIVEGETSKLKKALSDIISKNGEIVDFQKQSVPNLRAWLNKTLLKAGKQISPSDGEYFINLCERSLEKLNIETQKLVSSDDSPQITKELIDSLVKVPVEYKIFELSDALLSKDAVRSYKILNGFKIAKVQPIVIFSIIYGRLSDILMFKLLNEEGKNPALRLPGNKKWLSDKLNSECRKYSKSLLRESMKLCAKYDADVKKGNIDGYAATELLIAEILTFEK